MPTRYRQPSLQRLFDQVSDLQRAGDALERSHADELRGVPEAYRASARNFVHYLSLRQHDIRALQLELGHLGLSSLGRLEAHVRAGLQSVLLALDRIADEPLGDTGHGPVPEHFREGDESLARHAVDLLGPQPRGRTVRIMVTLPTEAAGDEGLSRQLVDAGMDVARINSAHDGPVVWRRMAENVRRASSDAGTSCRILVDLGGPKLRTGALPPGLRVLHFQPKRDGRGFVVEPAVVLLHRPGTAVSSGVVAVPVTDPLLREARGGDVIELLDVPGRSRRLRVVEKLPDGLLAHGLQSTYVEPGTPLRLRRGEQVVAEGAVGDVPEVRTRILVHSGDLVTLVPVDQVAAHPVRDGARVVEPARVPCSLDNVFASIQPGQRVLFDDGKIESVVRESSETRVLVQVVRARDGGVKLGAEKGINLPDTDLPLPALTEDDRTALDFAVAHADIVGLSFVRQASDLQMLHEELARREQGNRLGIVVKIETRSGFENLPQLLLTGLHRPPLGVMVARGDLGVEVGYERMAEVQEQILWLCEAAHVPVIWATQVLESLNKRGVPTRAEVTDAAMSSRSECVMLNKGPHVVETTRFLGDILVRMQDHHHKKTAMLRKLKVSEGRWEA